jgi:hypothetical protein
VIVFHHHFYPCVNMIDHTGALIREHVVKLPNCVKNHMNIMMGLITYSHFFVK